MQEHSRFYLPIRFVYKKYSIKSCDFFILGVVYFHSSSRVSQLSPGGSGSGRRGRRRRRALTRLVRPDRLRARLGRSSFFFAALRDTTDRF